MTLRNSVRLLLGVVLGAETKLVEAATVVDLATDPDAVQILAADINDSLGYVAIGCDFNRDGIEDLIVGASRADGPGNARPSAGEVYVVFGQRAAWRGPLQLIDITDIWVYGADVVDLAGEGVGCGDLNGDGWNDLVVASAFADGPGNTRAQAGDVHLLFGGPTLPSTIDLAATPGTIVYGDVSSGRVGESTGVAVGDVNADGTSDLLLGASLAPGKNVALTRAGRSYLVFGRTSWPATVDLRTSSNVTIFGDRQSSGLGSTTDAIDLDRDGTLDAVFGAGGGSGPSGARVGCGDVHVFRGRTTWPAEINLATSSATTRVVGVDSFDDLAAHEQVASGDLDGDGRRELWLGADGGDGRANAVLDSGEVLAYEPGTTLPPVVDLRTTRDAVIYGEESADLDGAGLEVGDINGDGRDDLAYDSAGDGPNNSRLDAGDTRVFHGPILFPADKDASELSLVVYGPRQHAGFSFRALVDLNNDGLKEIVGLMDFTSDFYPPSLWLISPYDTDGDGITQLADNCPLVSNATQLDADLDGRGDLCQADWDGDGLGDSQDCGPNQSGAGKPLDVTGVAFEAVSTERMRWQSEIHADRYDIARGVLPRASATDFGSCQNARDPNLTDTHFEDSDLPSSGTSFFYLVRAIDTACGGAGGWGNASNGVPRVNSNPNACP